MTSDNYRHAFRAQWHDYNDGIYFVTICTHDKSHMFGSISNGEICHTELGEVVKDVIADLPNHPPYPEILSSVVMPNHVHLMVAVAAAGRVSAPVGCLRPPKHGEACVDSHHNSNLAIVVGGLKSAVTRKYNRLLRARQAAPLPRLWQRLYHEHIVRSQRAYDHIMNYIDSNVANWPNDCFRGE